LQREKINDSMIYFDSDYMEGAHPEVMRRLMETNLEHTVGYGEDPYSAHARQLIRQACQAPDALVQFLIGGTQTNATVIDALLRRHEGVLAAETGHINVHESGAVEHSGHKVLTLPSHGGKVDAREVAEYIDTFYSDDTYPHMVAPGMLYITQPTELGSIYSLAELEALSEVCHKHHICLLSEFPDMFGQCNIFISGHLKQRQVQRIFFFQMLIYFFRSIKAPALEVFI
jgi:threonine aldolase